ncbi:hypothetical protein [Algoriphagus zhangzhouensis]|uniref:Helicase conserved C-terminal domain-containing protein n=1 Tax=Algoriphagus zhangzhouensis TaxID=1073327 RepID=A0A1M7ZEC6_9BACT|nr:hypothetical protein [Algoriphagus zhangzhouensis]TDY45879.1 hypothetical protein A8938_2484 [Algoriphagus zhangzhouensis]SHO63036.1 hypothetical protein SAMN04488108_2481 [Algoriphagus zhangzhouensis]
MEKRRQAPLDFIRNRDLIDSIYSDLETQKLTLPLPNTTKGGKQVLFGDVFDRLPNGIIHKSNTGMGATTCECVSLRNSIIVEPLRATAYLKYRAQGGIFVGTPPPNSGIQPVTEKEFIDYLEQPGFKKIFCVSDSLTNVMSLIPNERKSEFFLLIDETDTHQLDSSFRLALHIAMEVYKSHPVNMRATVTATPLNFSDPELRAESITEVIYTYKNLETVKILNTPSASNSIRKLVIDHFEKTPHDKLVVALNSVGEIKQVIKRILKHPFNKLKEEEIKVLCSSKRVKDVEEYYHELNSDILPGKLVFITAAYFSGYDLTEIFRLVVVIDPRYPNLALSEHRYRQIAGRARNGLIEGVIIYQWQQERYYEGKSMSEMLEIAKSLIDSFGCLTMNLDRNPYLKHRKLKSLESVVASNKVQGRNLLFWDKNVEVFKIAYLSIDSIVELNRLRKTVFGKTNGLVQAFEDIGYVVIESFDDVEGSEVTITNKEWFDNSFEKIKDVLLSSATGIMTSNTCPNGENAFESEVFEVFREYKDYVDKAHLAQLILKGCNKKNGWRTGLKSLKLELFFATQSPDGNFNHSINRCFPTGGEYSYTRILEKWDQIKTAAPEIGMLMDDPVFLLNRIFRTVRRKGDIDGVGQFYITTTRKIDERKVLLYKDKVSAYRFAATDYEAA